MHDGVVTALTEAGVEIGVGVSERHVETVPGWNDICEDVWKPGRPF